MLQSTSTTTNATTSATTTKSTTTTTARVLAQSPIVEVTKVHNSIDEISTTLPGTEEDFSSAEESSDTEGVYTDENGDEFNVIGSVEASEDESEGWENQSLYEELIAEQPPQEPSSQEGNNFLIGS